MAYAMIYDDLKNTGKCRLFIAKEPLSPNVCSFATAKSDPKAKILSCSVLGTHKRARGVVGSAGESRRLV